MRMWAVTGVAFLVSFAMATNLSPGSLTQTPQQGQQPAKPSMRDKAKKFLGPNGSLVSAAIAGASSGYGSSIGLAQTGKISDKLAPLGAIGGFVIGAAAASRFAIKENGKITGKNDEFLACVSQKEPLAVGILRFAIPHFDDLPSDIDFPKRTLTRKSVLDSLHANGFGSEESVIKYRWIPGICEDEGKCRLNNYGFFEFCESVVLDLEEKCDEKTDGGPSPAVEAVPPNQGCRQLVYAVLEPGNEDDMLLGPYEAELKSSIDSPKMAIPTEGNIVKGDEKVIYGWSYDACDNQGGFLFDLKYSGQCPVNAVRCLLNFKIRNYGPGCLPELSRLGPGAVTSSIGSLTSKRFDLKHTPTDMIELPTHFRSSVQRAISRQFQTSKEEKIEVAACIKGKILFAWTKIEDTPGFLFTCEDKTEGDEGEEEEDGTRVVFSRADGKEDLSRPNPKEGTRFAIFAQFNNDGSEGLQLEPFRFLHAVHEIEESSISFDEVYETQGSLETNGVAEGTYFGWNEKICGGRGGFIYTVATFCYPVYRCFSNFMIDEDGKTSSNAELKNAIVKAIVTTYCSGKPDCITKDTEDQVLNSLEFDDSVDINNNKNSLLLEMALAREDEAVIQNTRFQYLGLLRKVSKNYDNNFCRFLDDVTSNVEKCVHELFFGDKKALRSVLDRYALASEKVEVSGDKSLSLREFETAIHGLEIKAGIQTAKDINLQDIAAFFRGIWPVPLTAEAATAYSKSVIDKLLSREVPVAKEGWSTGTVTLFRALDKTGDNSLSESELSALFPPHHMGKEFSEENCKKALERFLLFADNSGERRTRHVTVETETEPEKISIDGQAFVMPKKQRIGFLTVTFSNQFPVTNHPYEILEVTFVGEVDETNRSEVSRAIHEAGLNANYGFIKFVQS